MRGQTIQFSGEQDASAFLATLDDDVSIDALTWGGRTTPVFLASDRAEQRHLLGDNVVRVVIGADPYDVEAHTLTLRFPNADDAARFRMKVLAGTLIIGTLAAPTAVAVAGMASSGTHDANIAPVMAPVAAPVAAPAEDVAVPAPVRFAADRQAAEAPNAQPAFVPQSKGTSEKTGEDNRSGASIQWIHQKNNQVK